MLHQDYISLINILKQENDEVAEWKYQRNHEESSKNVLTLTNRKTRNTVFQVFPLSTYILFEVSYHCL